MTVEQIRNQFIDFEGLRLKPYTCPAGYLTVGVGRNLETNGLSYHEMLSLINGNMERKIRMAGVDLSDKRKLFEKVVRDMERHGITRDEALFLLDNDISTVHGQLKQSLRWFDTAPAVIQEVLVDMCFNMGIKTLLTF
jgi:GH24 family phage-related lysozyme (muramidase)